MPIETSIYGQYLKPVKTIAEYGDEAIAREVHQNALQQSRLKADEYSRGIAEQNALRSAVQQFGPDRKANAQMLWKAGMHKAAMDYEKESADVEYKGAQTRQAGGAADKSAQEALKAKREQHAQMLPSVTTPESFAQWAEMGASSGVFSPQEAAILKPTVQAALQDPSKFPELLQRMRMLTVSQEKQYGEEQSSARNEATNVRSMLNTDATNKRMAENTAATNARIESEGALNRGQADRHFNERQAAKGTGGGGSTGKPMPASIIKGINEDTNIIGSMNTTALDIREVVKQIDSGELSLGPVSNVTGRVRNYLGKSTPESANLATFDTTIEKMRNAILLMQKGTQTEGDARRALNAILANPNDAKVVRQRMEEIATALEQDSKLRKARVNSTRKEYGKDGADFSSVDAVTPTINLGGKVVAVKTDAEYNALPRGTKFVTPDGKTGTKR